MRKGLLEVERDATYVLKVSHNEILHGWIIGHCFQAQNLIIYLLVSLLDNCLLGLLANILLSKSKLLGRTLRARKAGNRKCNELQGFVVFYFHNICEITYPSSFALINYLCSFSFFACFVVFTFFVIFQSTLLFSSFLLQLWGPSSCKLVISVIFVKLVIFVIFVGPSPCSSKSFRGSLLFSLLSFAITRVSQGTYLKRKTFPSRAYSSKRLALGS